MIWNHYYIEYLEFIKQNGSLRGFAYDVNADASQYLPFASDEELQWLVSSLAEESKKWFVLSVVKHAPSIPLKLLRPLSKAAVYEKDPSDNRWFIEVCLKAFGTRLVHDILFEYIEKGTEQEFMGALNALYWAKIPPFMIDKWTSTPLIHYEGDVVFDHSLDDLDADDDEGISKYLTDKKKARALHYENIKDLIYKERSLILKYFVNTSSENVRIYLKDRISLKPADYFYEDHDLLEKAREIISNNFGSDN